MKDFRYLKVSADDTYLMRKIYELRYEVYVQESHFRDESSCPDGIETDEYDQQSVHFAALNRDNEVVGTLRLILPGLLDLPVQKYSFSAFNQQMTPAFCSTEISRLIIRRHLRGNGKFERQCDADYLSKQDLKAKGSASRCFAKCVTIGLCAQAYNECVRLGIVHWYALMEPSLWKILNSYGFHFHRVGEMVDVYGQVNPYYSSLSKIGQAITEFYSRHKCPLLEPHVMFYEDASRDESEEVIRNIPFLYYK